MVAQKDDWKSVEDFLAFEKCSFVEMSSGLLRPIGQTLSSSLLEFRRTIQPCIDELTGPIRQV